MVSSIGIISFFILFVVVCFFWVFWFLSCAFCSACRMPSCLGRNGTQMCNSIRKWERLPRTWANISTCMTEMTFMLSRSIRFPVCLFVLQGTKVACGSDLSSVVIVFYESPLNFSVEPLKYLWGWPSAMICGLGISCSLGCAVTV